MVRCENCGENTYWLPFHCRRCNRDFCSKHRLPEDHTCPGLKRGNIFEGPKRPRPQQDKPPNPPGGQDRGGKKPPESRSGDGEGTTVQSPPIKKSRLFFYL